MNKNKKIIIGAIIITIVAVLVGWQIYGNKQSNSSSIKIGALIVSSGDAAAWGENAKNAIDLAVEEINNNGGINGKKIEVLYEDTAGEPKRAVSAYQKFVSVDKVDVIIGPLSQAEVAAVAPLIAQDKIPVVTPSYAPFQNRPVAYNPLLIWMDPTIEAEKMAEYVFNQGIKNISVVGTKDSWEMEVTEAFANKFSAMGGKVLFRELLQPDTNDVKATVTKALNSKPEAIFAGTYYQFVPLVKTIKELGYKGKLYSIEVDAYLAGETKPLSDNMQFIAPDFYAGEFMQKFEKKYNRKPGIPAGQAYDSMYILAQLMDNKKNDDNIIKAMSEFKSYDGVSGKITITGDYKTIMPTAIFEVQNGDIIKAVQ
ncbi:MAG: hypothetical protein D4Q79_00500 [Spirochaetia bacterium]|nr:MAG: hypothetical protein D4Q79_00500 [Spirochaetia bacterium]